MEKSEGKIGIREFVAIIILTIGTKLADDTPAILFNTLETAAWMAPIIIGIIYIIPIAVITKVITHYQSKNLIDVTTLVLGKYIGFFTIFILWILESMAITIDSAIYSDIIRSMYFPKTPLFAIYLVFMGVASYGAKKGLESIGSFAWSVLAWIKVSALLIFIAAFIQGEFNFIFPIFGPGKEEIIKESFVHSPFFTEFLYFGIIASSIKSSKDYKKGTWIGLAIVTIELSVAILSYLLVFDFRPVQLQNYPFHDVIQTFQFGFLTNVEVLFFPFWLLATFVRFSFYLYLNAFLFWAIFKIKQFEYAIPALATLFIFLGMIPQNPTENWINIRDQFIRYITPIILLMPFLLWLIAKVKGDLKK